MMKTEKRLSFRWILAALVLLLAVLFVTAASAEDWMAEARSMLNMINDFRTGGNAWYWNSDNTTWTTPTGLGILKYDAELEEVAKLRAQELSVSMSHTRPDGSKWSTAFPAGNYYKGENIACGFTSAAEAFNGFLEEDQGYEGQGHRRIMLKNTFTRVGLAAVEVNGVVYWVQEFASGSASAKKEDASAGWVEKNGVYYYIKDDGKKATGWLQDGDSWYYLNSKGAMQTGWQKIGGARYYFNDSGAMQTGWVQSSGGWYLLDASGVMQTGWTKDNGKWYFLDKNGVLKTGWIQDGGSWYYTNSSGVMQTGWKEIDRNWYYFRSSGVMVTGTETINGQKEYFSKDGVWQGSEIQDYATPLGGGKWQNLFMMLRNFFLRIMSSMAY